MAEVRRDSIFYEGGGGITLTGGESTLQLPLAEALLRLAKSECIATALETCGYVSWPNIERLLPYLDVVLFDLKHLDRDLHHAYTGVDNGLILSNLQRLAVEHMLLRVRIPLIPGFNVEEANLQRMARFIVDLGDAVQGVDLLPYHTLGRAKYEALARAYPWEGHHRLEDDETEMAIQIFRQHGLRVTAGG